MTEISRRSVLKWSALGVGGLASLEALSACSSGSTPAATAAPKATSASGLTAYDASLPGGPATKLSRSMAWANTADVEFFADLGAGMSEAADARGFKYETAIGSTADTHVQQMRTFLAQGVGSICVQPLDPTAEKPVLLKAISDGICAQGIITAPSTVQVAASQYQIGFSQGKAAADYAKAKLGGNAEVAYFNLDSLSPQLVLRHKGVLAGLKTGGPGIKVVYDAQAPDETAAAGLTIMNTVIEAHPKLKIALGPDSLMVGCYRALQSSGKLTPDFYISGVDGDSEALALVEQGGAYRLSIAFAWKLMGYGLGQFGADWVEGKSVPRVIVAKGNLLDSPAAVAQFKRDSANAGQVFADPSRYQNYLPLLGNVSYAQRTFWKTEVTP